MNKFINEKPRLLYFLTIFIYFPLLKVNFAVAKEFSIYIDKTRVIYNEGDRLQSLGLTNKKDYPILLQAKIIPENKKDKVNFKVTPPILKLDPSEQVGLSIVNINPIIDDKIEHLSYVCIKALPPEDTLDDVKKKQNPIGLEINVLVNICQKIIQRPKSIANKPTDIGSYLKWSIHNGKLKSENPTPYYIVFYHLTVDGIKYDTFNHIKPYSYIYFDQFKVKKGNVSWSVIEDYGGSSPEYSYYLK